MTAISVIIPFFNRKNLLEQAIISVLKQSYNNWQLLLVDDGSTDGASKLAKYYASSDRRIIYFKRPSDLPKGAPTCRNIGIEKAQGKYLMFLDSDDLLLPYCLEQRLEATEKYPEYDGWIFQIAKMENEQLRMKNEKLRVDNEQLKMKNEELEKFKTESLELRVWNTVKTDPVIQFLQIDSPWHTSGGLWRTSKLRRSNIRFDPRLAVWQDVDFHLQVLTKKLKLKTLLNDYPPDIIYRIHSTTISQKSYPRYYRKSQIYFFEKWSGQLDSKYKPYIYKSFEIFFNKLLSKNDLLTFVTLLKIKSPLLTREKKLRIFRRLLYAAFKKVYNKLVNF